MARQHWRSAAREFHASLNRRAYLEACRKYCPSLTLGDLLPYRAGIRAQAVDSEGRLVEDFLFLDTERSLHVCNAPSPAATSALPIGEMIADRLLAGVAA
jgi:L-2-hydroxyglutarate oxidase